MRRLASLRPLAGLFLLLLLPLLAIGVILYTPPALASPLPGSAPNSALAEPEEACPSVRTVDGVTLNECQSVTFTVGGESKKITVWYTNNVVTATRTVDGTTYTLSHGNVTDAQAQSVRDWGRQAWERYYAIFNRHPKNTGTDCDNNINVSIEDGIGWAGIAYWSDPGCWIGIDAPVVAGGGGQGVVYHEFQHFLQAAYPGGCSANLADNYPSNSEFVEGYADLAMDSVAVVVDTPTYGSTVAGYNTETSMYDKGYGNVYNKYFAEQLGTQWNTTDPWYHMDAVRAHYEACDVADSPYVLDTLIPSLRAGTTEESLFLDFFAANWAKDWANATTQPELVYLDDDVVSYGSIALRQNVAMATGSQSWNAQSAGQWAGGYYQVRPEAGCPYVTASVNGAAGAELGINLMAADITAPTRVSRSAWIGEDFTRTFAGAGVHDRIVAAVNGFGAAGTFDVSFNCATPVLEMLEPRQSNRAWVGDPTSPIAFLARFKVTSGGSAVRGLPATSFTGDAEGAATTFVPGSFQEVGEEYWVIMQPPIKPAGTTLVDLKVCLDGTICDTETDALLYVNPGNTDFALVFDASGSMATEDVVGEGTRVTNAKKAGTVLADLLRVGDRILVTDFSAFDNPPGCGLPGGDGNCALDLRVRLSRTDVVGAGTIAAAKAAIALISAREWTPVGAALVDAKNKLLAAPFGLNPKHIILLSDGQENVNPLYGSVRGELVASGVVIDTIAFSGDAPEALMAQIAADTGGSYRFVPTASGTLLMARTADIQAEARTLGVPDEIVAQMTAVQPGPLGLDDVYDYYETKGQDATRLFGTFLTSKPLMTWQTASQYVDGDVNLLRLVAASKQPDEGGCSWHRDVEVLPPGAEPRAGWIPISPRSTKTPADWDVRNSTYDDVVFIPNPARGTWQIRTQYYVMICDTTTGQPLGPDTSASGPYDVMLNGSVESEIRLQGRFLEPIVANQGSAGDPVPIVATLMGRSGTLRGATIFALIEKPGGFGLLVLKDDGLHNDGAANDGIYGDTYLVTTVGGTYNVHLYGTWTDTTTGQTAKREWLGGFWLKGLEYDDGDQDGMPDDWERRCKLSTTSNDATSDFDRDGLSNIGEFQRSTIPCDPDTDDGGERDGSEVRNQRNPLYPKDDKVATLGHVEFRPGNGHIIIQWTRPISYTDMRLHVSTTEGELGARYSIGTSGRYVLGSLTNDQTYYLTLYGVIVEGANWADSDFSETAAVTPKADPDAPSGAVLIDNGAAKTHSQQVRLNISAIDTLLGGPSPFPGSNAAQPTAENTVTGVTQMRVSNSPTFARTTWEPFAIEKGWTLADGRAGSYTVYVQFRDGAGNESLVVADSIVLEAAPQLHLYLPFTKR